MENELKRDNRGITLVELIVVIAIMAIMVGLLGLSLSAVSKRRVTNASASFKQTMQLAQTYSKSKGACKLVIKGTSDGGSNTYIYTAQKDADLAIPSKCRLGNGPNNINRNIKVQVVFSGVDDPITIGANDSVEIYVDRKTGGISTKSNYTKDGSQVKNVEAKGEDPGVSIGVPTQIIFSNGAKTSKLNIASYTGLVTYSK